MTPAVSKSEETPAKVALSGTSRKQLGMGMQLMVVVLGTWIGIAGAGGAFYFLVSSGKLLLGGRSGEAQSPKSMREITLEPVLANLADEGGHAYVRLGLRVEVTGDPAPPGSAEAKSAEPGKSAAAGAAGSSSELESSIRDTVLGVLGRQTSGSLLGADGKEHLKIELKEAIERGGVRVDVKDLFFTDFLVQI